MSIRIEVAYALPERQEIVTVDVPEGTSVLGAVKASSICVRFPGLDPDNADMGIFGKAIKQPGQHEVQEGDRIELYRPLMIDPKQARLNRAKKQ
ncbi:RnfH family protein [Marinobacter sp. BSs20148]|jgi:putative ubiquitin-RnfH superfamily antitoxin RatB of RatAB toxin-antitoxin module|uniref:RnfH family protein n=1 Tax=Marinobacter sp. BSs20148 TaxID=490759 RepID=UPI00027773F1|nr:RnfH family protein [Marinobacter sp. BSs20148]AFP32293.1 Protein rnfH [Marinobacter sp. BSs20148]